MTVRYENRAVFLEGDCPLDDANVLLERLLIDRPDRVDWTDCTQAHTGVIQVLIASNVLVVGQAKSVFLNRYIGSALRRQSD